MVSAYCEVREFMDTTGLSMKMKKERKLQDKEDAKTSSADVKPLGTLWNE